MGKIGYDLDVDFQKQHYQIIQNSIEWMLEHFEAQPSLDALAKQAKMSPSHFQKLFVNFVGVSPKQFLASITITNAKRMIHTSSLLDVTYRLGLSGTGRLHDLFIKLEGMTPGTYKGKGEGISLYYEFFPTIMGDMIVVSSEKGIQNLQFLQTTQKKMETLVSIQEELPYATWKEEERSLHIPIKQFLQNHTLPEKLIPLSVLGTPFQIKVWQSLLSIPQGDVTTYSEIATSIGQPNAQRAVGSAIGKNPIALLIPCHRVIQASGFIGGYRWNPIRKQMLLAWENALSTPESMGEHSRMRDEKKADE